MKHFVFVIIFINCLFFTMSCNKKGETYTVADNIYKETPTVTSTITPTVTPTP